MLHTKNILEQYYWTVQSTCVIIVKLEPEFLLAAYTEIKFDTFSANKRKRSKT